MALDKDMGNPLRMNSLACFIFADNRNINEGMELVEKALELKPDDYNFLDTKGWGYISRANIRKH